MTDRRPRLLSLDGGGARGWTQLVLLKEIIYQTKMELGYGGEDLMDENLYACEFFDLITGNGTGGVNAIMVGRLGMSMKQCEEAWEALGRALEVEMSTSASELLDASKLEEWAKNLVKEYTENEDTPMLVNGPPSAQNKNGKCCKVSVTAMRAQNIGMSTMFRTYRVRANQEYNCHIWEAIRATMASPMLYKPILIGRTWSQQEFINAELGGNNPVSAMIEEKQKVWLRQGNWPAPEIGCIVSVGSGKGKLISLPHEQTPSGSLVSKVTRFIWEQEDPKTEKERQLYGVMLRIAKDCERKHQQIKESYSNSEENVYFRFNVEHGMHNIEEHNYDEGSRNSMRTHANAYKDHADYEIIFEDVTRKLIELSPEYPRKQPEREEPDSVPPPPYANEKATFSGYSGNR